MGARRQFGTISILAAICLLRGVAGGGVLQTSSFSNCKSDTEISVQRVNIEYDNDNKTVTFNVSGTNSVEQDVTAVLHVSAYGREIYSNTFDPCAEASKVAQLCPVPVGTFTAQGTQAIPAKYVDMIPAVAFSIPDIEATATLQLLSKGSGDQLACITSQVTNGKTVAVPAVSYVAAGVAAAALFAGGAAALSAAASGTIGGVGPSPNFGEVLGVFQGMAMNGMHSVNYPTVYRNFAKNFGFSVGLIPWNRLQVGIDNFRAATGGNLTDNSVAYLQNVTMAYGQTPTDVGGSNTTGPEAVKRALDKLVLLAVRDLATTVNTTSPDPATSNDTGAKLTHFARGIQAYAEQLSIPSANTFMTVLLIVAIVIGAMVVGILLVKVVLEFWALFGSFPKALTGFREHYWGSIARAITSLILLLYGVWTLYCIFQFSHGDSWAAKLLAGVTLVLFTSILALFSYKIHRTAKRLKQADGDVSGLYDDKRIWVKYSLFYESYRKDYWWLFLPTIIYLFIKGCALAGADGHGMAQTVAQLAIEAVMLVLLIWSRPYERRSGNIINISTAVVRVLSVGCLLVFVDEFDIAETTSTVAGLVLIVLQSTLTGILAILVLWNALNACCLQNPHRRRRKLKEKDRHKSDLTPLDARNSLLQLRHHGAKPSFHYANMTATTLSGLSSRNPSLEKTAATAANPRRPVMTTPSTEGLRAYAAPPGVADSRGPTVPYLGSSQTRSPAGNARAGAVADLSILARRPANQAAVTWGLLASPNRGYKPLQPSLSSQAPRPAYAQHDRAPGSYGPRYENMSSRAPGQSRFQNASLHDTTEKGKTT